MIRSFLLEVFGAEDSMHVAGPRLDALLNYYRAFGTDSLARFRGDVVALVGPEVAA